MAQERRSPDYENYTRRTVSDIKNRKKGRMSYAKKGSEGKLDFTTQYKSGKEPEWIHETSDPKGRAKELSKYNESVRKNRADWKREYAGRKAYDESEGGIRHYDTKRVSGKKGAGRRTKKANSRKSSRKR